MRFSAVVTSLFKLRCTPVTVETINFFRQRCYSSMSRQKCQTAQNCDFDEPMFQRVQSDIASWIVIAAFKALIEGSSVGRDGQTIVYRGWGQA